MCVSDASGGAHPEPSVVSGPEHPEPEDVAAQRWAALAEFQAPRLLALCRSAEDPSVASQHAAPVVQEPRPLALQQQVQPPRKRSPEQKSQVRALPSPTLQWKPPPQVCSPLPELQSPQRAEPPVRSSQPT